VRFRAHIDGAARGNPGPAGAGVFVEAEEDLPAEELFEPLGRATNNVAEYRALLLALLHGMTVAPAQLLMSGLLVNEVDEVAGAFVERLHMVERERRATGEWAAVWLSATSTA